MIPSIVVSEICKESIWLRDLYTMLYEDMSCPTVFCDSESPICLRKNNQMYHKRTKHIDSDITGFEILLLKLF